MADVYSVSIAQVKGLNGTQVINVPPGSILVVRDIWAYWNSGSAIDAKAYAEGDYGQTFWFGFWTQLDTDLLAWWQGRMVLHTSLTLRTTQPVDLSVSGYQLALP